MRLRSKPKQQGFSLIGTMCTLGMLGLIGLLAVRGAPGLVEYWAISKAVTAAKAVARTPAEVRVTFDKIATTGYIDVINGKDLEISGVGDAMQVSFSYQKKIPLAGPASLLIDYKGSTASDVPDKKPAL